jgi:hypothetical protein
MERDRRYKTIAKLITTGQIDSFREIFDILPKTVVKADMHMHHNTFSRRLLHPESFTLKEMVRFASLIGVGYMALIELIYKQYISDKNLKLKK